MQGQLASVNAGTVRDVPWGSVGKSAIDKQPVAGPVRVTELGLEPDQIADLENHGGIDQAVYAYAREDLDWWESQLGRPMTDGEFGENLTTRDLQLNDARIGDRWRIGTTVLEVASVRIPCSVFAGFIDQQRWVRRFTEAGVPGPYLRVIEPGEVTAGDAIEVIERREHDITVGMMFRAMTTERELLPRLLDEPRIASRARSRAEKYVAKRS